jgi:NADH:ubiquinone oxidoreductase subunit
MHWHEWPIMATVGTKLLTLFCGKFVGTDAYGNRYYSRPRKQPGWKLERRWVIYRGIDEASKVPAEWHGWLHHTCEMPPPSDAGQDHTWQKPHLPNLTGTQYAYRPPGHFLKGGCRDKATGDYEPWIPTS